MTVENIEIKKLSYDTLFKAVFIREQRVLLKMIKDILNIHDEVDIKYIEVLPGYEVEPLSKEKKTFKTDLLIKLDDNTFINLEINRYGGEDILSRNILQVSRIYSQIINRGTRIEEMSKKILKQLNFNTFRTYTGKPIENIALCEIETGKVVSVILSFCNVDIEISKKLVYNVGMEKVSKAVRWGAILNATNIKDIDTLLGYDLLEMEEKKSFLDSVKNVNIDKKIMEDWMFEENARLYYEGGVDYARKKGFEEGTEKGIEDKTIEVIKNMLKEGSTYEFISKVTGKSIDEIKELDIVN